MANVIQGSPLHTTREQPKMKKRSFPGKSR